jgi:hypothetical protein
MRKVQVEIPPEAAGFRVVAVAEDGFSPKVFPVMGAFFFYIRDLRIKLIVFRLTCGV